MVMVVPVGVPVPVSTYRTMRVAPSSKVVPITVTFAPVTNAVTPRKPTVGPEMVKVVARVHVPPVVASVH